MEQALVQIHFIKFAPFKAAKTRLDFILLPTAELGSWQDLPFPELGRVRAACSDTQVPHMENLLGLQEALALQPVPCGSTGYPGPALLAPPAQRAQSSPGSTDRAKEGRKPGLISVGGRPRDPLKCSLPPAFPLTPALLISGLLSFRATSPPLPPVTTVLL